MNLAVNNFGKGLQTDTHPMIQGTDTLSDCLNGTLITMNGNEVILQNDMGNRRVNNAFLPPGYLPVGIKEYGGVIYVAAYNPITNKSQIGSFPSPLRNINNEIDKELLGNEFLFEKVLQVGTGNENGLNTYRHSLEKIAKDVVFLDNDVFLIPLTSDIVIHAGDKFVVSAKDLESIGEQYITNYRNVNPGTEESPNTTKAISPKNRRFTLSLGILNSQNEFVDITKTLCRWEKDGNRDWSIKKYSLEHSDIFKFNDGYFIPDEFDNSSLDETIEDSRLIGVRKINRQILEANTYAYKLIGPLYLKVALNHIETFSFSIYGVSNNDTALQNSSDPQPSPQPGPQPSPSDGLSISPNNILGEYFPITFISDNLNNEGGGSGEGGSGGPSLTGADEDTRNVNLLIDAFITYNCPDGVDGSSLNGNLDYETFDEGKPDFRMFDLIDELNEETDKVRKPTSTIVRKSVYNPNNNLYSLKLTKKYNGIVSDSNQYNYFLGVLADKELSERGGFNIPPVYLKGLSVEGTIDLDLLGSGRVTGDAWRFFNKVDGDKINTQLSIGLNAYIEPNTTYTNLRFKFVDMSDSKEYFGPLAPGTSFSIYSTVINGSEEQIPIFTSTIDTNIGINTVITTLFNESNFKSVIKPHEASEFEFVNPLPTRAAFRVYTYIDKYDETSGEYEHTMLLFRDYIDDESRWFLSTELFNEFFNKVLNFCSVETTPGNDGYNKDFADKMIVALDLSSELNKTLTESHEFTGSLVSESTNIDYRCNNSIDFTVNYSYKSTIKNKEDYPTFVEDKLKNKDLGIELKKIGVRFPNTNTYVDFRTNEINNVTLNINYLNEMRTDRTDGQIFTNVGGFRDSIGDLLFSITNINNSVDEEDPTKRNITGKINHNDILIGEGQPLYDFYAFDNFFDYINNNFYDSENMNNIVSYHGIVMNYRKDGKTEYIVDSVCRKDGKDFVHALPPYSLYYDNDDHDFNTAPYESAGSTAPRAVIKGYSGSTILTCGIFLDYNTKYGDYSVKNIMENFFGKDKLFAYIFSPNDSNILVNTVHLSKTTSLKDALGNFNTWSSNNQDKIKKGLKYARVWWRGSLPNSSGNPEWILINELLEKKDSYIGQNSINNEEFVEFLRETVKVPDYVYYIGSGRENSNKTFYSIKSGSYIYVEKHNLTIYLSFIFGLVNNIEGITFPSHGNLKFIFNSDSTNINEVSFDLISLNNFYKCIDDFNSTEASLVPIYIKNGSICDNLGNLLNSEYTYILLQENNKLECDNLYVKRQVVNGKPFLTYNLTASSDADELDYLYDHIGGNEISESFLNYTGVKCCSKFESNNV